MNYHCPRPPKQRAFDTSLLMWRRRFLSGTSFSPASLFASGEDGGWYDPSDLTSMFVLRTGSTLATGNATVGSNVGAVLDKSQMGGQTAASFIAGQPNIDPGETIQASLADTTKEWHSAVFPSTTGGVSGNTITLHDQVDRVLWRKDTLIDPVGTATQITFETSGSGTFRVFGLTGSGGTNGIGIFNAGDTVSFVNINISSGSTFGFGIYGAATTTSGNPTVLTVSNLVVKEIPGNHLVAPADIQRPVLRDEIVDGTSVDVSGQPELVTNGTFDTDITGWGDLGTATAGSAAWNAGQIEVTVSGFAGAGQEVVASGALNKWYILTFDALDNNARVYAGQTAGYTGAPSLNTGPINAGSYTYIFRSLYDTVAIGLSCGSSSGVINYDNISVREVPASAARRYYLDFDGVDDVLNANNFTAFSGTGVVKVGAIAMASSASSADFVLNTGYTVSATPYTSFLYVVPTNKAACYQRSDDTTATYEPSSVSANTAFDGSAHVFVTTENNVTMNFRIDGSQLDDDALAATDKLITSNVLSVGALTRNTPSNWTDCNVYGVIMLDRALTTAERENLEIYLANKSGATLA